MRPVIIIDANGLCHKAKHVVGALNNETMHTGVIFGFLGQILKLAKDYRTSQFCFCWDSSNSKRRELFPEYKMKRNIAKEEKSPEELEEDKAAYAQFNQLYEELLPAIGFKNNFKFDGYEGDDLIASIVDNNLDDFLIASGDEDLYQCICEGVAIIKKDRLYGIKDFTKEYGIDPTKWAKVKAIAGCTTDEVPGVRGVGEKTAIKYLNGELKSTAKTYQNITSSEGKQITERNLPLVSLPFKGCPNIYYYSGKSLSMDAFVDICEEMGFEQYLKSYVLNQWRSNFNMK